MRKLNWIEFYLLNVNRSLVSHLREVTTTDTYVGLTNNFHPDGLYSTTIFGAIGTEERDSTFAYIDTKLEIISPTVCLGLFGLKELYREIASGKRFAVWNPKTKDFEPALPSDKGAETGYNFFIEHFKELAPARNESLSRNETVEFFEKFKDIALSRYVLVLPAGNRDLMEKNGRDQEDEIAKLYRKLIALSKSLPDRNLRKELTDPIRWKLQQAYNDIWMYFFNLWDGKGGFVRRKVTTRRIQDGTRNVLSAHPTGSKVMGREDQIRPTDTRLGILQGLKSLLPVAQYHIRTRYLSKIKAGEGNLYGINKKTLKREFLSVPGKVYDLFTTDEGIEKIINEFINKEIRKKPLMIDTDHYVALIYQDNEVFKVLFDIDELPAGFDKNKVRPINLGELLYLSGYDVWNDYFSFVTRYPVTGRGSTYSSTIRLDTTVKSLFLYELEDDWETRKAKPATSFPDPNIDEWVDSFAPHPTRIKGLGADHDGDTGSVNSVFSDEALEENRKFIRSRRYWFNTQGRFKVTVMDGIAERTVETLLGD